MLQVLMQEKSHTLKMPSRRKGEIMSTSKEYHDYVMEQILPLGASSRAMMGEYVVYFLDKPIGGIYDNRFLVKYIDAAKQVLKGAPLELPYQGAKMMLLVEDVESKDLMEKLFKAMYNELPSPKKR